MTTWQLFIQALGYLMLVDFGLLILGCAYLAWQQHRESREMREIQELERLLNWER